MPLLLQTVEKAAAQNSQYALLAEGVAASVLLSRLTLLEIQTGNTGISTLTSSYLVKELLAYKDVNFFFCLCRGKVLQLLEPHLRREEATFHHREVPLSG